MLPSDTLLESIASTDIVQSDWDNLRDVIKAKIQKNISLFLSTTQKPDPPAPYAPATTASGGLKMPPFLPRKPGQMHGTDPPLNYMNEEEATEMKDRIFAQLDQFDGSPPFTIQRLCELCVEPMKQYKSVGKYLRAVEKSVLVTSTWDSFPPLSQSDIQSAGRSAIMLGSTLQSAPSTPLFSPIPFLHDDARRSKSRSPPPTPLTLNPSIPPDEGPLETKAIGLVDEFDDPRPGHMSDHPTALSSVTTLPETTPGPQSRPFLESLEERFVKAEDQMDTAGDLPPEPVAGSDSMELDEDKENVKV
ncbi:hypothetical protein M413DRAFT_21643 [Hebeloma cylindrosporum]|uniref:PPP4R2-domain-containing protein n=1 Tax=Hebeloma cylindrosporum TaxID=76867 RepID=A0A0C2YI05_HEBCY|nr:hypothetical protein M413DRAFT_21643 [Hebeloma cylindrosporum h7]